MSAEQIPQRLSLEEFLCRKVHIYEWSPTVGTHSPMPRRTPCADCIASAALVNEWWMSAFVDEGGAA